MPNFLRIEHIQTLPLMAADLSSIAQYSPVAAADFAELLADKKLQLRLQTATCREANAKGPPGLHLTGRLAPQ
jgi:hypothetical protein